MTSSSLRQLPAKVGFALMGLGYFQVFSHLDVNPILRNYLLIMPLQIGALAYVAYTYWRRRQEIRQPGLMHQPAPHQSGPYQPGPYQSEPHR